MPADFDVALDPLVLVFDAFMPADLDRAFDPFMLVDLDIALDSLVPVFDPFMPADLDSTFDPFARVDVLESVFDNLPFGAFIRLDFDSPGVFALESVPRVPVLEVLPVDNADLDPLSGDLPRLGLGVFVSADFPAFPTTLEVPLPVPRVFAPFTIFCPAGVSPVAFPF